MARISGVDIPKQKRGVISLTYIYGVGKSLAKKVLKLENKLYPIAIKKVISKI